MAGAVRELYLTIYELGNHQTIICLLDRGFDVFNLIPTGIALNKNDYDTSIQKTDSATDMDMDSSNSQPVLRNGRFGFINLPASRDGEARQGEKETT